MSNGLFIRDAILVAVIDSLTSTFAGCAIFSITGYMAYEMKVPVSEVTKSGLKFVLWSNNFTK